MSGLVLIMENRRPIEAHGEVNCAGCQNISDFNDEHRRGWCLRLRRAVSTWHPVRCAAYQKLTWERHTKVAWKGVVYE